MNWFIPREHGAWAMLIVPYLLGMLASNPLWLHLPFFIGVVAFYFASSPFLTMIRKPNLKKEIIPSLIIYLSIGSLFTFPILFIIPEIIIIGVLIIPFFLINVIFAKLKKERLFVNDFCAIIALSFLVVISYYIGNRIIDLRALILMVINVLFFTASVFHVKTLIREKGNQIFLWKSNLFHGFTVVSFLVLAMPVISVVFFVSSLKAWFMPKNKRYKPVQIGLIEIANSVIFLVIVGIFF
ncbi:hypothetical protein BKP37_18150 [Anaerobacillus alkalilacustris]|uniref:YwiC-like protein n=1 Tax=Anaerobacillus alkalilacustris TaxID=393763 RepID=A0A1S2LDZ6_9BACI|nr:YwiC-like family protein [Anaerobacillus alkalilacustris]OIJ10460.1 hypothetical protein BKP37_18150 [Anaerobacillus alkalilacustris]